MRYRLTTMTIAFAGLSVAPVLADPGWELNFYTGVQESPHSTVEGTDETNTAFQFTAGWEGNSFEMPPYWGVRVMRNTYGPWSYGLEFTHAKVYADDETLISSGFSRLEFTDGLNILTANAQRRMEFSGTWSGHAGLGLGVAVPHVEVTTPGGEETTGYELTGAAARWYLGARYAFTDNWSAFAEYNGTYSVNSTDLSGGGELETDIVTNAINLGIGFSF